MVSIWWLLVAFIGGASIGVLLMALMQMSAGSPEQSQYAPDLRSAPW
jgi:hypothetical protein